jgi:hypothetical protein
MYEHEHVDKIRVADFTETPGGRLRKNGRFSGEEYRDDVLRPAFEAAKTKGRVLKVNLDGVHGYAASFLEETFGGFARKVGSDAAATVVIESEDKSYLHEIRTFIREAND